MLSPGDQVFIDGNHAPGERKRIVEAHRRDGMNYYLLEGVAGEIPAYRITAEWIET
jgi:hypothetical protein